MRKPTVKPLDLALSMVMSFSPPCLELEEKPIFIQDIFSENKFTIYAFVSSSTLQNKRNKKCKDNLLNNIIKDNDDNVICLT